MKKAILLLFVVFTIQVNAQDYVPLAIEGAQWVIYKGHEDPDGLPPFEYSPPFNDQYYGYKIEGDITINGIDYKKVYRRGFAPVNPNTNNPTTAPFYIGYEILYGAVRDDIPNRKVYGIQFCNASDDYVNWCNCDEEILLYDFDMNVNDYYSDSCMFIGGNSFYIGEIVYQNIEGENRQVHKIGELTGSDTIILRMFEGIGSSFGLFENLCYFECNPKTFLTHYCVGTDDECLQDYLLATNEQNINNTIKIYPNPILDKFTIDFTIKIDNKIELFNLYGKRVFSKNIKNNTITIDMSKFNSGIYILKINKNQIYKLIKR